MVLLLLHRLRVACGRWLPPQLFIPFLWGSLFYRMYYNPQPLLRVLVYHLSGTLTTFIM